MDSLKAFSRQSFFLIILFMTLLACGVDAGGYFGKDFILKELTAFSTSGTTGASLITHLDQLADTYGMYLLFAVVGVFLVAGILLWLFVNGMAKGLVSQSAEIAAPETAKEFPVAKDDIKKEDTEVSLTEKKSDPKKEQRLYLHMLTVLQREGRLVDFLRENLDMYGDEQIGAAVRAIHDSCRKVLDKDLAITPVIDVNEGEQFTVEAGFNLDAIKLTGKVVGEPPFTGIVRHRGWRADRIELPELSATKDPSIIAPAEVELS